MLPLSDQATFLLLPVYSFHKSVVLCDLVPACLNAIFVACGKRRAGVETLSGKLLVC